MYLDLRVHSVYSKGVDSPARLKKEARDLGVDIVLCDGVRYCDYLSAIEIKADTKRELKKKISRARDFDIIVVHGGKLEINRAAAQDSRVGILAHPWLGRRDSGVDAVVAREAAKNGVAIELCFRHLLAQEHRIRVLSSIRRILRLWEKYKFRLVVTSGARSRYELRSRYEIRALLHLLGLGEGAVEEIMCTPQEIIEESLA